MKTWIVCFLLLLLSGCGGGTPSPAEKVYDVKGKVVSIDAEKNRLRMDHEEIPGLMQAMTMNFDVADASILNEVKPGDLVAGKMKRGDAGNYVITELRKR